MLALIAAVGLQGQLGLHGGLPWKTLKSDRQWFRQITQAQFPLHVGRHLLRYPRSICATGDCFATTPHNAVIMGRRTWESLPMPLSNRVPIILSHGRQPRMSDHGHWGCKSFDEAILVATNVEYVNAPHTFVIGGARVYAEGLRHPKLETLFLTEVEYDGEADTWWPVGYNWEEGKIHHLGCSEFGTILVHKFHRTHVSNWITEPDRPAYRFGLWERT